MKITIKNLDKAKYQTKPGKWTHVVVKGIATRTCQSKDGARTWLNVIFDTNIGNISGYETTLKKNFINYTNNCPEKIAFIREAAYKCGMECREDDVWWALFNEEEHCQKAVKAKDYDTWALYQKAAYDGLKAALLQKVQPPVLIFPSRLGQLKPASMLIFCTLPPNCLAKYRL